MIALLTALLAIIPCTGDLVTPNFDNDLVCWEELVDPDLAGFVIFFRAEPTDDWTEAGLVELVNQFGWDF